MWKTGGLKDIKLTDDDAGGAFAAFKTKEVRFGALRVVLKQILHVAAPTLREFEGEREREVPD